MTRSRTNMIYKVLQRHMVPMRGNITKDQTIELTSQHARERCPSPLRQVVVWDGEHERELVFLTNIFHLEASAIGGIYKDRWRIEPFFKALKQNLKIKNFVGTSENAVNVQTWTALIALMSGRFVPPR